MADKKTKPNDILSAEEKAAMRATVRERKRQAKLSPEEARAAGEADVQAAIADMPEEDRVIAQRVHEIVSTTAPQLVPRTFYGMPAYALNGKVICFFQGKASFKVALRDDRLPARRGARRREACGLPDLPSPR